MQFSVSVISLAAADGTLEEAELRLLEEIRYELEIDRLHAAAIEHDAISQEFLLQISTLDMLSRIFRLQDLLNNAENFGAWNSRLIIDN